jgi:hypothetical protein
MFYYGKVFVRLNQAIHLTKQYLMMKNWRQYSARLQFTHRIADSRQLYVQGALNSRRTQLLMTENLGRYQRYSEHFIRESYPFLCRK